MVKIVDFFDRRFEKYRKKPEPVEVKSQKPIEPPKYTPKTMEDFIGVLQRTPRSILDNTGRSRIAAAMSFDERVVSDIMTYKKDMVFVNEKDLLGPLMLDKLYKSGFSNFPVVDNGGKVKGVIHTEALNALEIKKTDRANKYMDKDVVYLHANDSLAKAVEEIERTNGYYFLVLDDKEALVGFFTVQMLLSYLLG